MSKSKTVQAPPKTNSKYRVIPNLTPRGRDIMMRLQNRSINAEQPDTSAFTQVDEIVNARRMNKKDIILKARENQEKITGLSNDLQKLNSKPNPPKEDTKPNPPKEDTKPNTENGK